MASRPKGMVMQRPTQKSCGVRPDLSDVAPAGAVRGDAVTVASRVRLLINESRQDLFNVRRRAVHALDVQANLIANSTDRTGKSALARIDQQLTALPHRMPGPVYMLALFSASNVHAVHCSLQHAMHAIRPSDFSVYHYDALGTASANFRAFSSQPWYSDSSQIKHRSFGTNKSTCINVGWLAAMSYILDNPEGIGAGYTHLWKFDADLEFALFSFQAFQALLGFNAPFMSQPAILPMAKGMRSSDRNELQALYSPTRITKRFGPTPAVAGRERLILRGWTNETDKLFDPQHPYAGRVRARDDIETMCPCIDTILLPAMRAAIQPLDPANEIGMSEIMNRIAAAAADASRDAGSPRPAGLVMDYTPLVHTDSHLRDRVTAKQGGEKGVSCPRLRVRPELPPGEWQRHMPRSWPRVRAGFFDVSARADLPDGWQTRGYDPWLCKNRARDEPLSRTCPPNLSPVRHNIIRGLDG